MRNRTATLLLLIILLPHFSFGRVQNFPEQDESQRIDSLSRMLDRGTDEKQARAIQELSRLKSERASKVLLKRLKHNLAKNKGNLQSPWVDELGEAMLWGTSPSENELLVRALAEQRYTGAMPTLRKMLRMKENRSGIPPYNLAYSIHQITGQTVEYLEDGRLKRFPEPPVKP